MIIDFTYENPTRIHFGKTAMSHLAEELKAYGKNVLLVYGKNSVKVTGLYDQIMNILHKCGKTVFEMSGVNSNPRYAQAMEGARMVRENGIDFILAVGGGSVIDCTKGISVSSYCEGDAWQYYWEQKRPNRQ